MLEKIRRTGFLYSIGIALNRVVPEWLFRFRIFKVYQIDPKTVLPPTVSSPRDSVQVSLAETEADILAVSKLTHFFPRSIDAPLQPYQAKINAQLAGAAWVARQKFDEVDLGLRIELAPDQSWLFAALVDGQFRRRGVYSHTFHFIVNHLHQSAVGQQFLSINPTNIASVKAHEKYFDSVLGSVIALRVFTIAFCFCRAKRLKPSSWITKNYKSEPISIHLG
jgi:hypothetical protein